MISLVFRSLSLRLFWFRVAELNFAVVQKLDPDVADSLQQNHCDNLRGIDKSRYMLAKSYFDVKEYGR